jgi:hypothetical protein
MGEADRLERLFEAALPTLRDMDRLESETGATQRIGTMRIRRRRGGFFLGAQALALART